jgi:3-isopropylmalate/(R)-2-methylmalate dehydratase small subunit
VGALRLRLPRAHRAFVRRHLLQHCYKNGLLPIVLTETEVDRLFADTAAFPGFKLVIDLEKQQIATPDGSLAFAFHVEPYRKHRLLNGLDDIGLTLTHADEIRAFETKRLSSSPG